MRGLPAGFSLLPMDDALLETPGVAIPREVSEALARFRGLEVGPLRDMGCVVMQLDAIVSWSTVDCISGGSGDVGFYTLPK